MFSDKLKKLGLVICVAMVSSCGIFSDSKELPSGKRISILENNTATATHQKSITAFKLPSAWVNPDWAQLGGNSSHVMGNVSAHNNMKKVWTANFGKGSSKRNLLLAKPIIYQGIVYAQDVNGTVSAFDLNDGKKIWKQKLKPLTKHENDSGLNGVGLAADGKTIFAVAGFGSVFALDAQSGKVLWRNNINTPLRSAPTVCGNKVLIQTLDNRLFALNTSDGSEIWKYNISAEDTVLAGGATPACQAEKNLVITGFSNGEIEAFNADIGYPLWSVSLINNSSVSSSTEINAIKASPVFDNNVIYAVGHNDLSTAINYQTGEKKWEQKIGGLNLPWITGEYIFILSGMNELFALNKNSGKILWQSKLLEEYELKERNDIYLSGPVMINSQLLVAASNGVVYAISPENGATIHKLDLGSPLPAAPIAADNTIIFITDDAELIAYK